MLQKHRRYSIAIATIDTDINKPDVFPVMAKTHGPTLTADTCWPSVSGISAVRLTSNPAFSSQYAHCTSRRPLPASPFSVFIYSTTGSPAQ